MNEESVMTHVGDAVSLTMLFGYLVSIMPTVALLFTIVWTGLRIYESYLNIKKLRKEGK